MKPLMQLCEKYKYKVLIVELLEGGDIQGECCYVDRTITIAQNYKNERGQIRPVSKMELLYTLAHEVSHMIRYEEGMDDDDKLQDAYSILYGDDEVSKAKYTQALLRSYRHELQVDYDARELLIQHKLWRPDMLNCVIVTHMYFHKLMDDAQTGEFCTASYRRMGKLQFPDMWKAQISKQNLKIMQTFRKKYPQFSSRRVHEAEE